jgi:hypothetical protein
LRKHYDAPAFPLGSGDLRFGKTPARHTRHRVITSAVKVIFESTSPSTPSARQERHQPRRQELECHAGRYVRPANLQEQAFKEKLLRKLRESLISRDALEAAGPGPDPISGATELRLYNEFHKLEQACIAFSAR